MAELLSCISRYKPGALNRLQLGADADLLQAVDRRFTDIRVGAVAVKETGVEAVGVTRLGQQFLDLGGIINGRRQLPVEVEVVGNNAFGDFTAPSTWRASACESYIHP